MNEATPRPTKSDGPTAELLGCPFCTKRGATHGEIGSFYVECQDCAAQGPYEATQIEAVAAWNRRPSPAQRAKGPDTPEAMPARDAVRKFCAHCGYEWHDDRPHCLVCDGISEPAVGRE